MTRSLVERIALQRSDEMMRDFRFIREGIGRKRRRGICSEPGCGRRRHAKGLCLNCYLRRRKRIDLRSPP